MGTATAQDVAAQLRTYEAAAALRPWASLAGPAVDCRQPSPTTALDLFLEARRATCAVSYFDCRLDHAVLDALSDRLAAWWFDAGVQPGDRIAIVLQNTPAFVIATLAAWKIAAIAVPINPMYRAQELTRLFDDFTPAAVLCHDDQWATLVAVAAGRVPPQRLLWSSSREMQLQDDARVLPLPAAVAPKAQSLQGSYGESL